MRKTLEFLIPLRFHLWATGLLRRSYITDFTITDVTLNDAASGYDVEWSVRLPTTNDFMTATTILIGE